MNWCQTATMGCETAPVNETAYVLSTFGASAIDSLMSESLGVGR